MDEQDRFRDRAWAATADLTPEDRELVFGVVDEWLDDHPHGSRPEPEQLVRDVREELGVRPVPVPPGQRWWTRRRVVVTAAAVMATTALLTLRWWLTYDSPPDVSAGFVSDDLEHTTIRGLQGAHTVFRCEPGTLQLWADLFQPDGRFATELESVTIPQLDENGWATRVRTEMLQSPTASPDDREPFTGARMEPGEGYVRLVITWELGECPDMAGVSGFDTMQVDYRVLGVTRHATVPISQPLRLTTMPLEVVDAQYADG